MTILLQSKENLDFFLLTTDFDKIILKTRKKSYIFNVQCLNADIIKDLELIIPTNRHFEFSLLSYNRVINSISEALLAYFISLHTLRMCYLQTNQYMHIVFAHAFPVFLTNIDFKKKILNLLDKIVNMKQLLILPEQDLVLVEVNNKSQSINQLLTKYKKVERKNIKTKIVKNLNVNKVLISWKKFCKYRFSQEVDNELINLFEFLYSNNDFYTTELWLGNNLFAQSLVFKSITHNILFDVLAPWDYKYKNYSPGIFLSVSNIKDAYKTKMNYSLCYGKYKYKDDITRFFNPKKTNNILNESQKNNNKT